jgi:hypothetical protein
MQVYILIIYSDFYKLYNSVEILLTTILRVIFLQTSVPAVL